MSLNQDETIHTYVQAYIWNFIRRAFHWKCESTAITAILKGNWFQLNSNAADICNPIQESITYIDILKKWKEICSSEWRWWWS